MRRATSPGASTARGPSPSLSARGRVAPQEHRRPVPSQHATPNSLLMPADLFSAATTATTMTNSASARRLDSGSSATHHAPLRPTVQGMCLVASHEELYCAEHPCRVTVRSCVPSTKFHAKTLLEIPLPHADAYFRALHHIPGHSGTDGWVWCAASSGELVAIHTVSKKHVMIADSSKLQEAGGPIVALSDVWTLSPIPGSLQRTAATETDGLQARRQRVAVSVSRSGVVGLWDTSTRTLFAKVSCVAPSASVAPLTKVQPLSWLEPKPGHALHNTHTPSQLRVKCCSPWTSNGILFVGVGLTSSAAGPSLSGMVYVVDLRRLSHATCTPLTLPDTVAENDCLDGAVLSMELDPSVQAHDQGALWVSTSSGAVARIDCGAATGAGAAGSVLAYNVKLRAGVHEGFCHKLCLSSAQHVVTCGSDGRVVIMDVDTLNIIQKVTLDAGTMVQELSCLGEMAASRGSVTMLLAISDRTFRCMSLKRTGPWAVPSRGGSPSRGSPRRRQASPSAAGSPRASPLGRRQLSLAASFADASSSGVSSQSITTQQLLYHCMALLQDLKNLEQMEVDVRSDLLESELVARDMLYHYWDYLYCGGRAHNLPSRLWFVQLQEADTRQYFQQEAYLELRAAMRQCNRQWHRHSAQREVLWGACWEEEEERHQREVLETTERLSRNALRESRVHLGQLVTVSAQRRVDASDHDNVLARLEGSLVRLTELEPEAAKVGPLQADVQRLAASLSSVTDACQELEELRIELETELRRCRSDLHHRDTTARLDGQRLFLDFEEVNRCRLREEAANQFTAIVSAARREEGKILASLFQLLQEERSQSSALQHHRSTLESVSIHLQRDLRDAELSRDGQRAAHRRLEDQALSLQEQLSEMTRRLSVSEEQRTVTELELLRCKTSAEQHRARLEQSTSLAEDTFKTVLAQRTRMQAHAQSFDALQERLDALVRMGEDAYDAGITEKRVHRARSALREAQEDLIAIRRAESHRWVSLEDDMANTWSDWMRHTHAAERELQPSSRMSISASRPRHAAPEASPASLPSPPVEAEPYEDVNVSMRTQEHLHHAFDRILAATELIGPQWMDQVLVLDKSHYFDAIRKTLTVLAAARGNEA